MDASTHTLDASARPYLLRALHQWCSDEGLTPYVAVWVDERVEVPRDFVQDNQIVL
ncbi:MAG: ClpXP protease specificity-enhancing factor SspB, partial [Burkholderiaceae bacterium]